MVVNDTAKEPTHIGQEKGLLSEIEDFVNKPQLTVDEVILKQVYPTYFFDIIRNKYFRL